MLSQDEAWELMTVNGAELDAAGFEVRVPPLSRRRPSPDAQAVQRADGRVPRRRPPAQQRALVGGVRRRRADRGGDHPTGLRGPPAGPGPRPVGGARPGRPEGGGGRAGRAGQDHAALGCRDPPARPRPGAVAVRARWRSAGRAGPPSSSSGPRPSPPSPSRSPTAGSSASCGATRPRPCRGWRSWTPPSSGGCLALDMGLGKTPTVLAHIARTVGEGPVLVIAPPAVVGQLGRRVGPLHPRPARRRAPRRLASHRRRAGGGGGRTPTSSSPPTGPRSATSTRWPSGPGPASCWTRRRPSRTPPARPRSSSAACRPAPAWSSPAPRSRTASATCGRCSTSPTPASSVPGPPSWRRWPARARPRCGPSTGSSCSGAPRPSPMVAAELPDRIDELDHCTMTRRADRPVPGGAGRAGGRHRGRGPGATPGGDPGRHHRAQADLQPPRRLPGRRTARWPGGPASWPASRRSWRRSSRPASASWCSPTSPSGAGGWPRTSPRSPGTPVACYDGSLSRGRAGPDGGRVPGRRRGPERLVLSLKAGGTGLNLTAASHVVLYDRWWNPAVEDQARDRAWRIGQTRTVVSHRLVCPGTVDERVEEVVAGKRHIADLVLPGVQLAVRPQCRAAPAGPRPPSGHVADGGLAMSEASPPPAASPSPAALRRRPGGSSGSPAQAGGPLAAPAPNCPRPSPSGRPMTRPRSSARWVTRPCPATAKPPATTSPPWPSGPRCWPPPSPPAPTSSRIRTSASRDPRRRWPGRRVGG